MPHHALSWVLLGFGGLGHDETVLDLLWSGDYGYAARLILLALRTVIGVNTDKILEIHPIGLIKSAYHMIDHAQPR